MPQYFFLLGNTPELSLVELQSYAPQAQAKLVGPHVAIGELPDDAAAIQTMDDLGGLVKITRLLHKISDTQPEAILNDMVIALTTDSSREKSTKITYAVAELGRDHLPPLSAGSIKKQLLQAGFKARYIDSPRSGLSASVLLHHQNITELVLIQIATGVFMSQTVAIQDIDRWSFRDRSKPYADRKKGMLPPKVARMMVNLALSHLPKTNKFPLVYDPFSGSGTVLMEAMLRDCRVIASDLDPVAVAGTEANLKWLVENIEDATMPQFEYKVFLADATHVNGRQLPSKVDTIVTEPFLGKPQPRPDQVADILKGLAKLYWGALKNWTQILKPQGIVVMVLPVIQAGSRAQDLQTLIDKLPDLGYTTLLPPVMYNRAQAVTQRQVVVLQYQPK